jgi:guanylate kinase
MRHIVAFVGPSGGGKTAIMKRIVAAHGHRYGILPGFLTRPLREGEEDLNLTVIPTEEGKKHYEEFLGGDLSRFVNVAEYAGTYYGNERAAIDNLLQHRIALKDLVPNGVMNFRRAGYHVDVIIVEPVDHTPRPGREEADRLAALQYASLEPIFTVNTYHKDPDGLAKAVHRVLSGLNE